MRHFLRLTALAAFLLTLAAAGLFLEGGRQYQFTAETRIKAAPNDVFRYLTDEELVVQWIEGLKKIESITDEGQKTGARARLLLNENGRQIEMTDEVLQSVPGDRLELKTTGAMFQTLSVYQLQRQGETTLLKLLMLTKHQGVFRVLAPFVQRQIQQRVEQDLQRLKSMVEASAAETGPTSEPDSSSGASSTPATGD